MSLRLETRIKAMGYVGFAVPGTPAWIGDHPGFAAAIADGGAGIFTVSLDGEESPGEALFAFVTAVGDAGVAVKAVAPTNTRDLIIHTNDYAGAAVDNVPVQILAIEMPAMA